MPSRMATAVLLVMIRMAERFLLRNALMLLLCLLVRFRFVRMSMRFAVVLVVLFMMARKMVMTLLVGVFIVTEVCMRYLEG